MLRHLFWIKSPECDRLLWLMSCVCAKNTLVSAGVFPLKEIITVHRFVRFMNHGSLKPEIFPTPVNEPHCFQHVSGGFRSASIGFSAGVASSHRRLSQPVPLPTRVLILNIELLNMPAFRLDFPLFLPSDSTVIVLTVWRLTTHIWVVPHR